ncbi:hypothetical protein ACLOJK_037070, partial [Asimina triloba]
MPQCHANLREAGVSVRRGVLRATLGEMSSGSVDDQLFRHPFDVEPRALKIFGDLLPVQSKSLRKSHALSLTASLDKEGRELAELMLLEFLPDAWRELMKLEERIHLIDGCSSRAEYHYHVLRERVCLSLGRPRVWDLFGMSRIMSEEEHRKIITTESILRSRVKALWERAQEVLAGLIEELGAATLELGWAKETRAELLTELDAMRAERDKTRNDAEGTTLAKQGLEQALEEAAYAREEASRLSFKLSTMKDEATTLRDQVGNLGVKEVELSSKLESSQAEITQLQVELKVPRVKSSQGGRGDASGQVLGPAYGEHRALIISKYLCSDAHR